MLAQVQQRTTSAEMRLWRFIPSKMEYCFKSCASWSGLALSAHSRLKQRGEISGEEERAGAPGKRSVGWAKAGWRRNRLLDWDEMTQCQFCSKEFTGDAAARCDSAPAGAAATSTTAGAVAACEAGITVVKREPSTRKPRLQLAHLRTWRDPAVIYVPAGPSVLACMTVPLSRVVWCVLSFPASS